MPPKEQVSVQRPLPPGHRAVGPDHCLHLFKPDSLLCLRFSEGAACGQSPENRAKTLAEVKLVLQTTGFPWHIVALEEVGMPSLLEGLGVSTGCP